MTTLEMVVRELPPELQAEVFDFAQFLLNTKTKSKPHNTRHKPTFRWAGALKELREKYTSVELQHEVSRWRTDER